MHEQHEHRHEHKYENTFNTNVHDGSTAIVGGKIQAEIGEPQGTNKYLLPIFDVMKYRNILCCNNLLIFFCVTSV